MANSLSDMTNSLSELSPYRLVDLLRHGEVEGERCFRGRRDDPLSAAGWAQLEAATGIEWGGADEAASAGLTDALPWDRILSSPAARCAEFAHRLGERLGLPVERVSALRERDFGDWEGLRADQIPTEALSRFWSDPSVYDPPASEPFAAFRERVIEGWQRILDGGGRHLLLITHGGVIRVILGELLGIPDERLILLEVPTACRSRVRLPAQGGRPSLVSHCYMSRRYLGLDRECDRSNADRRVDLGAAARGLRDRVVDGDRSLSDRHGGDLQALARRSGRAADSLLDFSANINPLGMPASAKAALISAIDDLGHYPDPACNALRAAIGAHLAIDPERVLVGNGAEQLIWWLPRLVGAARVVVTAPAYLDYGRAAEVWKRPLVSIPLLPEQDFGLDLERLAPQLRAGDLVWIGQPNNPTGRLVEPERLRQAVIAHPQVAWAIDEAFIDFVDNAESAVRWEQRNLIVVRSMTKFYALAGLRLGYAVLPPAAAAAFARLLPEWSVNSLAAAAGTALLKDPAVAEFAQQTRELIRSERRRLTEGLRGLGVGVIDGSANYLLLRLPAQASGAADLASRLLRSDGIAVRVCDNYDGLDARYLRIAVRTEPENRRLLDAMARRL
jgi:L-threonine-O-3-phosphate decarboxylase